MKKSLIIPALATLLAVSCSQGGGSGNGKKDWNADLKDAMDLTLGEILPFASLDSKTTEYEYYSFFGYGGVIEIQDENKKNVLTDYDTKLTKAGFAYEEVPEMDEVYLRLDDEDPTGDEEEEEPVFAWHKETYLGDLWVSYAWQDEYVGPDAEGKPTVYPAGNVIAASLAYYEGYYESDDFPFDLLQRFFRHYDILIDEQMVPAFEAASADAYYQFDASWASYFDWVDVYVNYATSEELKAYKDALVAAGWTVTSEDTEEAEDWRLTYENSGAWVDLVDYTYEEEEPYVALSFYYILPPVFEIGFEEADAMFAEAGIDAPLAAYEGEALYFDVESYPEDGEVIYYIDGSSHDEMDAFAEALEEAGWTLEADRWGDYTGYYGRTQANVYIGDYIDYSLGCIVVEFTIGPEVFTEINFSEALEVFDYYGFEVLLPAYRTYTEGRLTYQVSEDGLQYLIKGTTEEELNAFVAVLAACGWDMTAQNSYGDCSGSYGNVSIEIENWIGFYYDGVIITFSVNRWDSELIAAYYAYMGIEGEVPVPVYVSSYEDVKFEFDASWVSYGYPLYADVYNTTEEDLWGDGLEEDGYFGLLDEAGWSLTNYVFEDDYSAFEWSMQVGEYDAFIYVYNYLESDGYVEFAFYAKEHVNPAVVTETFPFEELNGFLDDYDLGFTLTAALPLPAGETEYTYSTGSSNGWHYFEITVNGDVTEEWNAALTDILTAAGYELKTSTSGSEYWANEDDHQVSIGLEDGVTYIQFWE